jgi:hypothetical protein
VAMATSPGSGAAGSCLRQARSSTPRVPLGRRP